MYAHSTVCSPNILTHFPNGGIYFVNAAFYLSSCIMNTHFEKLKTITYVFSIYAIFLRFNFGSLPAPLVVCREF